jgi:phosphoserine phosphatase SerB
MGKKPKMIKKSKKQVKGLVVFDIEGILIPKNRYLIFELSRKVGFKDFIGIIILGFFYEVGILSLEKALRRIYSIFKGIKAKEFLEIHKNIPLIPGVEEVFNELKAKGFKTALISSGVPIQVAKDLANKLQADYAYGLELEIVDEHLTGNIRGDLIKKGGKAIVLQSILEKVSLTSKNCIMVADDRNNLSMFPLCSKRIGYNPDFVLTAKSDFVSKGPLTEILPLILGENKTIEKRNISKKRWLRETIHISSYFLNFICIYVFENLFISFLIFVMTLIYMISEFARVNGINIPLISSITWKATNNNELFEFTTSPIHFALGIMISLLIFPEPINYVAITILTFGDGGAHIFGMKFGKNKLPFNKGKNIEGTFFGFLFAFLGSLVFVNPITALIAASVGMLIEGIPSPINDNISMPLISGLIISLIA